MVKCGAADEISCLMLSGFNARIEFEAFAGRLAHAQPAHRWG